ncbi:MAG: hypothetical protein OXP73_01890 [Chloroflexota bacterium]|nr:hypothetical protein [Chloroflexota bacterium]
MYREVKDYIETLIIGQGRLAGQPMQLFPWQRRFLRGALRTNDAAALSLARGGGKTTFIAAIAAAALAGPLAEPMAAGAPNSWPVRMTSCNMQWYDGCCYDFSDQRQGQRQDQNRNSRRLSALGISRG